MVASNLKGNSKLEQLSAQISCAYYHDDSVSHLGEVGVYKVKAD
jgi:hypothetical protein